MEYRAAAPKWICGLAVIAFVALAAAPDASAGELEKKHKRKDEHPSVTIGKQVKIELTGRIEAAVRGATPAVGLDAAQADWQSRRIGLQGTAFGRIKFEVSREFIQSSNASNEAGEESAWREATVDARVTKAFGVEAGRFKLPFGREELTGEGNLDFVYRSLPMRAISPGRDTGVMAHGRLLGSTLEYQAGYFTRDGSNARTSQTEGGRDAVAARLVVSPFAASTHRNLTPIEFGVAIVDSHVDDRLGIRGRSALGDSVFFDRVDVNGRRQRVGIEASGVTGPVAWVGEYVGISDERLGMGFSGADLSNAQAAGWYVAGTWTLIGARDHRRLGDSWRIASSTLELVGRVEALGAGATTVATSEFGFPNPSTLAANADHATTVGVNWHLNRYARVQANVIRESIDDPNRSPAPAHGGHFLSTVIAMQLQL